ncbi:MAG: hypothetical protein ACRCUM_03825 [Mycoplasmoidaceae bacterium]
MTNNKNKKIEYYTREEIEKEKELVRFYYQEIYKVLGDKETDKKRKFQQAEKDEMYRLDKIVGKIKKLNGCGI